MTQKHEHQVNIRVFGQKRLVKWGFVSPAVQWRSCLRGLLRIYNHMLHSSEILVPLLCCPVSKPAPQPKLKYAGCGSIPIPFDGPFLLQWFLFFASQVLLSLASRWSPQIYVMVVLFIVSVWSGEEAPCVGSSGMCSRYEVGTYPSEEPLRTRVQPSPRSFSSTSSIWPSTTVSVPSSKESKE